MSSAVLEAPPDLFGSSHGHAGVGGRKLTLEGRLELTWQAAQRDGIAECPVCGGGMLAEEAAARCGNCDAVIS